MGTVVELSGSGFGATLARVQRALHQPVTRCHYDTFSRPLLTLLWALAAAGFLGALLHCYAAPFALFDSSNIADQAHTTKTQNGARQHQ